LHVDRLNENQGAESTLSFVQSLLEMKQFAREYQVHLRSNGKRSAPLILTDRSKAT
jgi:hypothetical protein